MRCPILLIAALMAALTTGCMREPELHLYDEAEVEFSLPVIDLSLDVFWDYELNYDITYDWTAEWFYGWDDTDRQIFGEMGYTEPTEFQLRRYYTASTPYAPHTMVMKDYMTGKTFRGSYEWGYWDLLVWNNVITLDGVHSLYFDETTSLDKVIAYTGESTHPSRYQAPRHTRSFYEPEPLFAAYVQGIDISPTLEGFEYDEERGVYVRMLNMELTPVTYIYLTQVILHNNHGRIAAIDGEANLSGMASEVELNTGVAGTEPITVYYKARMKKDCDKNGERVDIVGGRVMTFGLCNTNGSRVSRAAEVNDHARHYMDVAMQFNNGNDSTFVFDVTEQVRKQYKGGIITVELDVDTIPVPSQSGGSGFDATVRDVEDGGSYEFEVD